MKKQKRNNKTRIFIFSFGFLLNAFVLIGKRLIEIPDWIVIILSIIAILMMLGYIICMGMELRFKGRE